MECQYCVGTHRVKNGSIGHGEELTKCNSSISVTVWTDGYLNIETNIDNVCAAVEIQYCPMCGKKINKGEMNNG